MWSVVVPSPIGCSGGSTSVQLYYPPSPLVFDEVLRDVVEFWVGGCRNATRENDEASGVVVLTL